MKGRPIPKYARATHRSGGGPRIILRTRNPLAFMRIEEGVGGHGIAVHVWTPNLPKAGDVRGMAKMDRMVARAIACHGTSEEQYHFRKGEIDVWTWDDLWPGYHHFKDSRSGWRAVIRIDGRKRKWVLAFEVGLDGKLCPPVDALTWEPLKLSEITLQHKIDRVSQWFDDYMAGKAV